MGKSLRDACSREARADWKQPADRQDPLQLLQESNVGRVPEHIPIRCGRMVRTPLHDARGGIGDDGAAHAMTHGAHQERVRLPVAIRLRQPA